VARRRLPARPPDAGRGVGTGDRDHAVPHRDVLLAALAGHALGVLDGPRRERDRHPHRAGRPGRLPPVRPQVRGPRGNRSAAPARRPSSRAGPPGGPDPIHAAPGRRDPAACSGRFRSRAGPGARPGPGPRHVRGRLGRGGSEQPEAAAPEPRPSAKTAQEVGAPEQSAPAAAATAPAPAPAASGSSRGAQLDQETFDRVLEEQLGKGVDRRVAEGRARAAAVVAARKKAEG
jgi:hypothetical protein